MTLRAFLAVLLLAAPLLAGCVDAASLPPSPLPEVPTSIPSPAEGEIAVVSRVVDGDTIDLQDGRTVRYIGMNTPERGEPYYDEARQANRDAVEGQRVWLVLDAQTLDRYGRLLAYVWAGDLFVNLELVRRGYANTYTEPPNVRYSAEFVEAERRARETGAGLWQPAGVPVQIRRIEYDAPGQDDQNPNGEWVELVNNGAQEVDLAGFRLKDAATHIYEFPDVRLGAGRVLFLYSGQGKDDADHLYWGLENDAVWNNDGDTAYLWDAESRLVATYTYP